MSDVNVPVGYKKTEIGFIPNDWNVMTIHDIASFSGGSQPPKSTFISSPRDSYIRLIQIRDYKTSKFESYIPEYLANKKCNSTDIMIGRYGPPIFQILRGIDGAYNVALIKATPKSGINQEYLYYFLKTEKLFQLMEVLSRRSSGQTGVDLPALKSYPIPLPKIEEQTAIVTALSDVDNLIQSLERLISKKEAIKTATMQQLLTGKSRLPEFATCEDGSKKGSKQTDLGQTPEDWEVKTVFELAERNRFNFNDGDWVESEHITNHGIRLLQTGNIGTGHFVDKDNKKYISEHSFMQLNCKLLEVGDLLICRLAEPAGRACIFKGVKEEKAITSVDVTIFRPPLDNVNREFYLHVFSSSDWFNSINEQVGGTTHKRISRSALGSIYVPYPVYEEQTAIATILSDMDAEIQALNNRLTKTQDIKQGMMQQLLTGKVRLAY